jgi:hypothetical protein
MAFDLGGECATILDLLDALPDHSSGHASDASELVEYRQQATVMLAELQQKFPSLANKRLGGVNRLYLFDPKAFIKTLERDIVAHWLQMPESLGLSAGQMAVVASRWYNRPVTDHRIKRRFKDPKLTSQLQLLCYEHGNTTDISKCRSLPEIQKRLRLRFRRSANKWTFRGEITFYDNGTVTICDSIAQQDQTAAGKKRIRGNGSAVAVDAMRNVLLAHS